MLELGLVVTTNRLSQSEDVSLSIRVRVRVTITLFPDIKDRKIKLGGLGSVTSKSGKSGSNPRRKHVFDYVYASMCARDQTEISLS